MTTHPAPDRPIPSVHTLDPSGFAEVAAAVLREEGRGIRFPAYGRSMAPCLRHGDLVEVVPLRGDPPRIGEIVFSPIAAGDRLVVHRVIRARRKNGRVQVLLKGDRASGPDGWIDVDAVLGRVVARTRDDRTRSFRGPFRRAEALLRAGGSIARLAAFRISGGRLCRGPSPAPRP